MFSETFDMYTGKARLRRFSIEAPSYKTMYLVLGEVLRGKVFDLSKENTFDKSTGAATETIKVNHLQDYELVTLKLQIPINEVVTQTISRKITFRVPVQFREYITDGELKSAFKNITATIQDRMEKTVEENFECPCWRKELSKFDTLYVTTDRLQAINGQPVAVKFEVH